MPFLACLSWKGLNFVLGSWLTVDRGWDRTSVCCYGCRTFEGDGWIITANEAEEVSGCPEVARDPCLPSGVAGPSHGQFNVGPVPRLQPLSPVDSSQPEPAWPCTMNGAGRGARGNPGAGHTPAALSTGAWGSG